jgi:hypothetical protein
MRINPIVYGFIVLTVFFGIILGFQATGIWSISGKVDASGEAIQPSAADVNTIKGWMTLEQIATTFNVPLADLLHQFELPADTPATTAIKDLESESFDTTLLKDWLQSRTQPSVVQPVNEPTSRPAQPVTPTPEAASASITATSIATEHVAPAYTITGKTTFQELLDWGVSKDAIQFSLGGDMPSPSVVIKDYVTEKGLEFAAIKTSLQAEVDKVK